jgi:preprotein translocase subunit SecF
MAMRGWPLIKVLPIKTDLKFVSFAKYAAMLSAVLVIASLVGVFRPGLNLGIDFRGGAVMELTKPAGEALDL